MSASRVASSNEVIIRDRLLLFIFIGMKSSLPALFIQESQTRYQQCCPEKQPTHYGLDYSHSYRARILNPLHRKSAQQDRIPASSHLVFKQRYSEYPSRSLSMQDSYEHNPKEYSTLSQTIDCTRDEPGSYSSRESTNRSIWRSNPNAEEIDNVRVNIRKVAGELVLLRKVMEQLPDLHGEYLRELSRSRAVLEAQVTELHQSTMAELSRLSLQLSSVRKQTGLQIKSVKRDLQVLQAEAKEEAEVLADIEKQRAHIQSLHF